MKTKTIYLLRHGQTDFNKQGMVQGRGVDASLNAEGQQQAKQVFEALKNIPIDQFYTSALKRTWETIDPFSKEHLSLSGFDEISWGAHEGITPTHASRDVYWDTIRTWADGDLSRNVGGGENPLQVMKRQKEAMQVVLSSEATTVLICMHGRAMRILLCWLLNYSLEHMDNFEHQNCCYYQLVWNGETFSVRGFNVTEHLG